MTRIEPTVSPGQVDHRDSAMAPRVASASDAPSDARPLGGIWPAVLTMFDAAGAIDEHGTARHVEYLLRHGARGLVAAGTSGEFIALDNDERLRVIRVIIDATAGRVPVYAGTGHYATRHTITMTEQAERAGAAGVIVILPYFQKPPKPAVLDHFRAVRAATSLPLMLYNNPANSACVELTSRDVAAILSSDETPSVPLSERERTAMVLYASGLKIEAVARRMNVKPATAQEYIRRVREKYSRAGAAIPTKTDMYRRARDEGLVP